MQVKKKKYKLSSSIDFDFTLIGIVSSDKLYKLSWHLNKAMGVEFHKADDLIIAIDKQDITKTLEVFASSPEMSDNYFTLIANKCENGFLLNQFKNFDFILKVGPALTTDNTSRIIDNIQSLSSVLSIFNIDMNLIKDKDKQYFIF